MMDEKVSETNPDADARPEPAMNKKSILITFSEIGEPEIFFNAATDEETAELRRWLEGIGGGPAGLLGGVLTAPGPAPPGEIGVME
jgi:hypothetical protein